MVKAQFPIGKTQWAKWSDEQRAAFNEARAAGVSFPDAVVTVNSMKKQGPSLLEVFHEVADAVQTVSGVVTTVAPVISAAKTVVKATKGTKGK